MYILHTKWAKIQYPIGSPFRLLKRTSVEKNKKLFHTLTGIWLVDQKDVETCFEGFFVFSPRIPLLIAVRLLCWLCTEFIKDVRGDKF